MNEKPGCRICYERIYHDLRCRLAKGLNWPILDSERKDFGRMAQATAESLARPSVTDIEVVTRPTIDHYWREGYYAD